VHERTQDAAVVETLEVRTGLAEPPALADDVAEAEAPADERVEVGAADDDVAAMVDGRAALGGELVEDIGVDERERRARAAGGERAGAGRVAVALQAGAS
jgi:hypothetical protein